MPILDTAEKQQFVIKFLKEIAKTQYHRYWKNIDPVAVIADLGLKAGQNRVKTLRNQLQKIMPNGTGTIFNSDITKDNQTVAGFIAVALARAKFANPEPKGTDLAPEILALRTKGE